MQHHIEDENGPHPGDEPALKRMETFNLGHIFRADSRIRIAIDTPVATRPPCRPAPEISN